MATKENTVSAFFLAHGSPMLALQKNEFTQFLNTLVKQKPDAVVIFTAHWEAETTTISSINGKYDMIYDFYNFPKPLYEVVYPVEGSVKLSEEIKQKLQEKGIKSELDTVRGIDHGAWSVLYHMFPNADVPVVQVSVNPDLDPRGHLEIGKALRELSGNIMVIGSGVTVHNLRVLDRKDESFRAEGADWAQAFDDWIIEKINKKDIDSILDYKNQAPNSKAAVPTTEHFVPLLILLGLLDLSKEAKILYRGYQFKALSYLSFQFA